MIYKSISMAVFCLFLCLGAKASSVLLVTFADDAEQTLENQQTVAQFLKEHVGPGASFMRPEFNHNQQPEEFDRDQSRRGVLFEPRFDAEADFVTTEIERLHGIRINALAVPSTLWDLFVIQTVNRPKTPEFTALMGDIEKFGVREYDLGDIGKKFRESPALYFYFSKMLRGDIGGCANDLRSYEALACRYFETCMGPEERDPCLDFLLAKTLREFFQKRSNRAPTMGLLIRMLNLEYEALQKNEVLLCRFTSGYRDILDNPTKEDFLTQNQDFFGGEVADLDDVYLKEKPLNGAFSMNFSFGASLLSGFFEDGSFAAVSACSYTFFMRENHGYLYTLSLTRAEIARNPLFHFGKGQLPGQSILDNGEIFHPRIRGIADMGNRDGESVSYALISLAHMETFQASPPPVRVNFLPYTRMMQAFAANKKTSSEKERQMLAHLSATAPAHFAAKERKNKYRVAHAIEVAKILARAQVVTIDGALVSGGELRGKAHALEGRQRAFSDDLIARFYAPESLEFSQMPGVLKAEDPK